MSQKQKILDYMRTHDSITSMQAIEMFGCTRLSGRIFDLREDGYNIVTDRVTGVNRFGEKTEFASYRLIER